MLASITYSCRDRACGISKYLLIVAVEQILVL